jgi:hypothetical protein
MSATAAATGGSAAAALTGDSLNVRNYGEQPEIIAVWDTHQTAGFTQLAFPTGHDTTRGFRAGCPIGGQVVLPLGSRIPITPQETITGTIAATAVAGDVENTSWLTAYDVDKGQKLIDWPEVSRRLSKVTTIEASIASSAGPGYSGTELINADSDLLIANRDYALLGFSCRTAIHLMGIQGPDTGNDRIGCPGFLRFELTSQWFRLLSNATGEPCIPVINSGNKGSTNFFVSTDENAGTFLVTAHLVLLKS